MILSIQDCYNSSLWSLELINNGHKHNNLKCYGFDLYMEPAIFCEKGNLSIKPFLRPGGGGGGGTSFQEATGDVPLDGVVFSRMD